MYMRCLFLIWSVLLCLIKNEMVSSSIMARSEMVGCRFGSKVAEAVNSEQRRKPKKASTNMASRVRAVCTEE